jgi:hypothetical protein
VVLAGISPKQSSVRAWHTFAGANHFYLTAKRIPGRSQSLDWNTIADVTAS